LVPFGGGGEVSDVSVVEVTPQMVLGMRKRGKYREISEMIPRIFQVAQEKNAEITGRPMFVCHERGAEEATRADAEGNADVEVVIPVRGEVEGTEEVKSYELPGGQMAKIIHKGPYDAVGPTYEALFKWLEENSKKIMGPFREVYVSDPRNTPPEQLVTVIYVPIA
jgi:effector-binding domain-containing protein